MTAIAANTISFPATKSSVASSFAAFRADIAESLPNFADSDGIAAAIGRTALALIPFSALAFIFIAV